MSSLISAVSWVRRGVAVQHPPKYVLDDKELERVSALARIELEDARTELERAHEAAKSMDRTEGEVDGDDDEGDWVECVAFFSLEMLLLKIFYSEEGDETSEPDPNAMDVDETPQPKSTKNSDDLSQYNLDDYDDDDVKAERMSTMSPLASYIDFCLIAIGPFSSIKGLTYYKDNAEDPYITLHEVSNSDSLL